MRIHFVGADLEENLGLGILAAVTERAGHRARIVPFNDVSEIDDVVRRAMAGDPDVIGLSIQFQHRAPEFLELARELREAGYRGHLTCGGQFPTLAWRETLEGNNGVDSIVLHDGEETIVELLGALVEGRPLFEAPSARSGGRARSRTRVEAREIQAKSYPLFAYDARAFTPCLYGMRAWSDLW